MSEYIEALGSDEGIGMEQILREAERDTASWKCNDMPGTETLRRMILLADWASIFSISFSPVRFTSFTGSVATPARMAAAQRWWPFRII